MENHNGNDAEARLDGTDSSDKWIFWDSERERGGNSSSSQKVEPQKYRRMFKWWKHATGDRKLEQRFLLFEIKVYVFKKSVIPATVFFLLSMHTNSK